MKKTRLSILSLGLISAAALAGCNNEERESGSAEQISVVASFYPMYEFARHVAGDRAEVSLMVSSGEDAHHYEPSAKDVAGVNEAEVFVYSSEEMEHWVNSLLNTVENEDLIIARTAGNGEAVDSQALGHDEGEAHHEHDEEAGHDHSAGEDEAAVDLTISGLADHYHTGDTVTLSAEVQGETAYDHWHWYTRENTEDEWRTVTGQETNLFEYKAENGSFEVKAALLNDENDVYAETESVSVVIDDHKNEDPHIWLDLVLAQEQVNIVRNALIEADPEGESVYQENAKAFNEELQALHEEYETAFSGAENRVFVVQHQAFGYIADRYDLEQIAIGGLSTEVEPSPSRIAEIGGLVEQYNVPVIYYQQGANSAIAETVANETGTETAVLYDLEVLSEELKSKDLGYLDAMRDNLEALQFSIQ